MHCARGAPTCAAPGRPCLEGPLETTNDRRSAPPQGAAVALEAWIPGHLRNGCLAATLAVPKTGAE